MDKKKFKIFISALLISCIPFLIISCEEDTPVVETVDQLFRPVLFVADVAGNEVTLSWVPIKNASYSLEVSRDSMLFTTDLKVFLLDGVKSYVVGDLLSNSMYSARIKSISKVDGVKDSDYKALTFMTGIY